MPLNIALLQSARPQTEFHYFPVTGSTMTAAFDFAANGAPHGTVVVADEQTAGIGRFGRHWQSEAEAGIYCSVILRLTLAAAQMPVVTLALGLATAEAIQQSAGLACDLRWPNDVLIRERKAAGILAHFQPHSVVSGIGINVNQSRFPDDLRTPATSLRMAGGHSYEREPLILSLLDQIDRVCTILSDAGPPAIITAFSAASSYVANRRIICEEEAGAVSGTTAGLDENGFLRLKDTSGTIRTIYSGGIRPVAT